MGYSIINKNRSIKIILMIFIGITTFVKAYAYSPDTSNPIQINRSLTEVNSRHPGEVIVLIHGLMRTYVSMKPLKAYLELRDIRSICTNTPPPDTIFKSMEFI